jgi:hypothetical protein
MISRTNQESHNFTGTHKISQRKKKNQKERNHHHQFGVGKREE